MQFDLTEEGGEVTFTVHAKTETKTVTLDLYEASVVISDLGQKFEKKPQEEWLKAVRDLLVKRFEFPTCGLKVAAGFVKAVRQAMEELRKNAGGEPTPGSPTSMAPAPSPSPAATS